MTVFLAAALALVIAGMRISGPGQFNTEYLDKRRTTAVNGIFVILIVFSHYCQYADMSSPLDAPYMALRAHLDQMVVATFLFYSGYGMMESVKRKGDGYVRKLPSKFLKLLFRFDCAVLLFLALAKVVGNEYPLRKILLSFVMWESVGNSNWYIFDILVMYILVFMAFTAGGILFRRAAENARHIFSIGLLFVLTVCFVFVLMKTDRGAWWYNTVILLPCGFTYSVIRGRVEGVLWKNDLTYALGLAAAVLLYVFSYRHRDNGIEAYTLWAGAFIVLLVIFTMKVRIGNRILEWTGSHVFSLYILQRLPMIALDHLGLIGSHKYLSLIAVIVITVPLAIVFEKITDMMIGLVERGSAGQPAGR